MNELRTLLEEFWICRDADKEEYYRVRRDVPNFQKFVREQMGWKLIHTENLIKLEKVPAHALELLFALSIQHMFDFCKPFFERRDKTAWFRKEAHFPCNRGKDLVYWQRS